MTCKQFCFEIIFPEFICPSFHRVSSKHRYNTVSFILDLETVILVEQKQIQPFTMIPTVGVSKFLFLVEKINYSSFSVKAQDALTTSTVAHLYETKAKNLSEHNSPQMTIFLNQEKSHFLRDFNISSH